MSKCKISVKYYGVRKNEKVQYYYLWMEKTDSTYPEQYGNIRIRIYDMNRKIVLLLAVVFFIECRIKKTSDEFPFVQGISMTSIIKTAV